MTKIVKKISFFALISLAFIALCFGAFSYNPVKAETIPGEIISISTTAKIRYDNADIEEDQTGLSFSVTVNRTELNALTESGEYEGYDTELGVAIIPTEYLTGFSFDASIDTYLNQSVLYIKLVNKASSTVVNVGEINETVVETYTATLTKIPSVHYGTDVSARAYVKLTKADADPAFIQSSDVATHSIGDVAVKRYSSGTADENEIANLKELINQNLVPTIKSGLGVSSLASFDQENYLGLIAPEDPTKFSEFSIDYLEYFQGKKGVLKISGALVADETSASFRLDLPRSMTKMTNGTQVSNGQVIKGENNVPINFDLTNVMIDMFVETCGSPFGLMQTVVNGVDYGWGGKEFTPTPNEWFTHKTLLITGDNVRFGVSGVFEFYVAGIYEGTDSDRKKSLLAENLRGVELANFDSQEYLDLVEKDRIYSTSDFTAEIGDYFGKTGVLKLSGEEVDGNGGAIWINLPKAMTQMWTLPVTNKPQHGLVPKTTITLLMYVAEYPENTFGLFNTWTPTVGNLGWNNLNFTPPMNKWFYHTPGDDVITGDNVRIGLETGGIYEIYIAAIYQGDLDTVVKTSKGDLKKDLKQKELANFNSEDYIHLVEGNINTMTNFEVTVGDYHGKTGVIKISATTGSLPSSITISLPGNMIPDEIGGNTTQIALQTYFAVAPEANNKFGINNNGWKLLLSGNAITLNTWQNFSATVPTDNSIRFYLLGNLTIEMYISVIMCGDASVLPAP